MKPPRRVFVVGGAQTPFLGRGHPDFVWKGHPDFGARENPTLDEHIGSAVLGALAAANVPADAIEKGYVGNFLAECFARQGHLGAMVAAVDPGLHGKPFARIEAACASGAAAIAGCIDAMAAGHDVTLAVGAEVESGVPGRDGIDFMARAAHYDRSRAWDPFTFPWLFARRAKAYKEAFGATDLDLGGVVEKAYANASGNPDALMRAISVTAEEAATASERNYLFLEDEALRDHIRLLDCTSFTDGAAALVLATEAGLARLGIAAERCTEILAYGHTVRALGDELHGDPLAFDNVAAAAAIAYRDAGVGPDDVEIAEVHDCFSISELLQYEAIGLAGRGEGAALLRSGATARDGRIPVNPGGGLLGGGHPIGATGVRQVLEIHRQAHGLAAGHQLARPPRVGVASNLGGDDRTAVVTVLRRA